MGVGLLITDTSVTMVLNRSDRSAAGGDAWCNG